ncbi:MAG TPA: DUF1559 domain-containing protein [Pirellulales bacterium]|nr:DUF1559 domain-containing protein [Pirellulales bacterium]
MSCPRCGAESGELLPASGGRATCRRCGASVSLGEPEQALPAVVVRRRRGPPLLALVLIALLVLVTGAGMALRVLFRALEARMHRAACEQQLHKLAVALQNYADEHNVYPPAVVRDAQGNPLHSWRVLILPQLGQEEEKLHKEYHYDEPWNGPHNRELASRMPAAYRCPEDPGALDFQTSYLAIVDGATGDFAAYPTSGSTAPPKKPPLTAYLVVEYAESGVNWMEPRDVTLGANGQPDQPLPEQFGYHVGGGVAVDAAGATIVLPHDQMARALVTPPASSSGN